VSSGIPFRPRSASEIVDAAFQLLRGHFGQLAVIAAVVLIPSLIVSLVNVWTLPPGVVPGSAEAVQATLTGTRMAIAAPLGVAAFLWLIVGFGALVAAAADAYLGRPVQPAAAFRRAFARAGRLIGGHLLTYLVVFGLLLVVALAVALGAAVMVPVLGPVLAGLAVAAAFVAGCVWLLLMLSRYFTITPVLMLEDVGAVAALGRSSALSAGSRGRIVGIAVLVIAISVVVVMVSAAVSVALPGNPQLTSVVANLFYVPLYPLFTCVMTVLYYDLRIRKEGYDIELMARELGEGAHQPAF
jgi:hypothetical protein